MCPKMKKRANAAKAGQKKKYKRFNSYTKHRHAVFLRKYKVRIESQDVQDIVREKDLAKLKENLDEACLQLNDMIIESRNDAKTGGGGGGDGGGDDGGGGGKPPHSSLFYRLVDEAELADCILNIVDKLFHGAKKCNICKVDLNLYDFFLLTHYYFNYIKILERNSNSAFCDYLNQKVFAGIPKIGTRNFNIYAQKEKYTNFAELLKDKQDIRFVNRPELPRPKTEHFLLAPFQEIGWNFQHSGYYDKLRVERDKAKTIII